MHAQFFSTYTFGSDDDYCSVFISVTAVPVLAVASVILTYYNRSLKTYQYYLGDP